jgi:hypothetical protein
MNFPWRDARGCPDAVRCRVYGHLYGQTMIATKLPKVGTTIFSVLSQLALQH